MVGLNEFGEASWAMEQLLNSALAEQKAATAEFCTLCSDVLSGLTGWINAVAGNHDSGWSADGICSSARAMQTNKRYLKVEISAETENPF